MIINKKLHIFCIIILFVFIILFFLGFWTGSSHQKRLYRPTIDTITVVKKEIIKDTVYIQNSGQIVNYNITTKKLKVKRNKLTETT